ncbi:antitoxin Xre/MbcA/ParS toxin-binding domain-containing protein [Escherichia sp. MOD1-EC6021]|uniref:antitoxin Xre/MbcA/ParS toxin-binding domain-containing protein n=1 Tax=Escherichia sp. MOD1-EC6021 TaxID=2093881 RepID=UPI000CF7AB92|nr:antitoxin Xre/MbcA/ParS toxin-binding domain-containing protein [Escherichia sp. MOD1-EC6021]
MLTKNDVLQKAIDLFEGNESAALNWCNEPNRALQWKTPSEIRGRLRERAKSYAKALANDILR